MGNAQHAVHYTMGDKNTRFIIQWMLLSSLFEQSLARNYNQIHDAKNEQAKKSLTGLSVQCTFLNGRCIMCYYDGVWVLCVLCILCVQKSTSKSQ